MLSISRISSAAGSAKYYGADDYYITGEADAPGLTWGGEGAAKLGLEGEAKEGEFKAILEGRNPDPEGPDVSKPAGKHHAGWDMTFSAPKSISVMILLGGDQALDKAHDKAVQRAMDYAEKNLAITRVREKGEVKRLATENLVYASTVHGTSRAGDPQRHTHVVVANMTFEKESGEWRALESREIYRSQVLLTKIYQAELGKEAMALGYDLRKGEGPGTFELDAWTKGQLGAFSKRAATIQAAFEAEAKKTESRDLTGAEKERLVLKDRPKKLDQSRSDLVNRWREEAKAAGIDPAREMEAAKARGQGRDQTPAVIGDMSPGWTGVLDRPLAQIREYFEKTFGLDGSIKKTKAGEIVDPYGYVQGETRRDNDARAAVSVAVQVTELRSAVFTRSEVLERALDVSKLNIDAGRLEAEIDRMTKSGLLVPADKEVLGGMTTTYAIALERDVVAKMEAGKGAARPILSKVEAAQLLTPDGLQAAGAKVVLNEGQMSGAAAILTSTDRYVAVQGYAGVGKTTMFGVVNSLAESADTKIHGLAPTHRAADALKTEAGIDARTVASWLVNFDRTFARGGEGKASMIEHYAGSRILVDEASMISNGQMQQIIQAADQLKVSGVIFVGDKGQLPSQSAGAPFRLLLNEGVARADVSENMRQRNSPTLREAVEHLAMGRPADALKVLDPHITEVGLQTKAKGEALDRAMAQVAFEKWKGLEERLQGLDERGPKDTTRIVVGTNAMRGLISDLVREDLKARGDLARFGEETTRYYASRVDGPLQFRGDSYRPGEVLVFNKGVKASSINRGAELTVVGVDQDTNRLNLEDAKGKRTSITLGQFEGSGKLPFNAYVPRQVEIATGDKMVWERADAKRGYFTGAGFTVTKRYGDFVQIEHANGKVESLRASDPALKFSGYDYAETADRAQGQTYRSTVSVLSSTQGAGASVARLYVMESRPSEEAHLVTDDKKALMRKLGEQSGLNHIAMENLREGLKALGVDKSRLEPDQARDRALQPEPLMEKTPELGMEISGPSKGKGRASPDMSM